jgi:hypothetical protein
MIDPRDLERLSEYQMRHAQLTLDEEILLDESNYALAHPVIALPMTFTQASRSENAEQWIQATDTEITNMIKNQVWTQSSINETNKKPIGTRLVYTVKYDATGNLDKFKCRLVALGYIQKADVEHDEIFSPVGKIRTIYLVRIIAVQCNLIIQSLDFEAAFLNAPIDLETFIKLPIDLCKRYYRNDPETNNIFRLNRALYGLHQSPILWFKTLSSTIIKLDYQQSKNDPCLCIKQTKNAYIYIVLYVDDTLVVYKDEDKEIWLNDKDILSGKYKLKDLGNIKEILKINIIRKHDSMILILNQSGYINQLINEIN